MASKIELKLALPATAAAKVSQLPWLQKLRHGPQQRERLGERSPSPGANQTRASRQ
jgi:hypothetical protein